MDQTISVLMSMAGACPMLLTQVVGLVLAIARWQRHPRVSMLLATSMVVEVVLLLVTRVAYTVIPQRLVSDGSSAASVGTTMAIVGGVTSLVHAVSLGVLIAAVLSDRSPTRGQSFSA